MTQKQTELLFKDLCARLPYGVKVNVIYSNENGSSFRQRVCVEGNNELNTDIIWLYQQSEIDIKPYLFPLSSITKEQEEELAKLGASYGEYALHDDTRGLGIMVDEAYIFFEFCYKHHIDFFGLIKMVWLLMPLV